MLASPLYGDESSAPPASAAAPTDLAAAMERYTKLMEQAEGAGRHCPISDAFKQETFESLRAFAAAVEFEVLDPTQPIRVVLPEGYYNPRGRTLTFDAFELAIEQKQPTRYISMTKTDKGVLLESKVSILTQDGKIFCMRDLSATIGFKGSTP